MYSNKEEHPVKDFRSEFKSISEDAFNALSKGEMVEHFDFEMFFKNLNNKVTAMKKHITIITNAKETEAPTGKSFLANQISLNYDDVVYMPGKNVSKLNDPFFYLDVDEFTELIIIDDVPEKYLRDIWESFFVPQMVIEKRGESRKVIDTPNIIITSSVVGKDLLLLEQSYECHTKIIETEIIEESNKRIFKAKRIL